MIISHSNICFLAFLKKHLLSSGQVIPEHVSGLADTSSQICSSIKLSSSLSPVCVFCDQ